MHLEKKDFGWMVVRIQSELSEIEPAKTTFNMMALSVLFHVDLSSEFSLMPRYCNRSVISSTSVAISLSDFSFK